jgi:hypothetical protein
MKQLSNYRRMQLKRAMVLAAAMLAAVCFMALAAQPAQAQASRTDTADSTFTIDAFRDLTVSPSTLAFGNVGATEMIRGYTDYFELQATVKANAGWTLSISGSSATWSNGTKQRSDLQYKTGVTVPPSNDAGTTLTGSATSIYTDGASTNAGIVKKIFLRSLLHMDTDIPASITYNNIVLTLSAS